VAVHELRWLGPLLDCSGYSSAGRGYLRAAQAIGLRLKAVDRSRSLNLYHKGIDDETLALYERMKDTAVSRDCPTVQHQVPDQFYPDQRAKLKIGYTIFEMAGVPKGWIEGCHLMDVIWTGSSYSKTAFVATGCKTPIEVLPHAIDLSKFNDQVAPWPIKNLAKFNFISVFDFTERKDWRRLLRAYWSAFTPKEDVCLILKVYFGNFSDESTKSIMRRIEAFKAECKVANTPRMLVYGHDVPQNQMAGLYRCADCYVGMSREGFGIPYAEAMACGLACIGPEVGGNREFMNPYNSFLVKYVGDEKVGPETSRMYPNFASLRWSVHSWEHLAELMRQVVYGEGARKQIAKAGMEDVSRNLNPVTIGKKMVQLLERGVQDGQPTIRSDILHKREMSKNNHAQETP